MDIKEGTIQANGLEFSYIEMGEGEPVFCFHGYPDTAHTWVPTLQVLATNGYRAIAPFMRGYYPTEIPADNEYSAVDLGQDVLALIAAFGYERAKVIGHDWGAMAVYSAASQTQTAISKMITVAIPHPRALKPTLGGLWKSRHFISYQIRWYALWQHQRNIAEQVSGIFKRWSPDWKFGTDEVDPVVHALSQPGRIEAALGYYWSFGADQRGERNKRLRNTIFKKTEVATLCIVGANDGALDPQQMVNTPAAFSGPYEYKIISGSGHFLHQEKPDKFHQLVLNFFAGGIANEL
ncbi:MAG: alpha/beta fold hydrolase [Anaerolineae bacterium]